MCIKKCVFFNSTHQLNFEKYTLKTNSPPLSLSPLLPSLPVCLFISLVFFIFCVYFLPKFYFFPLSWEFIYWKIWISFSKETTHYPACLIANVGGFSTEFCQNSIC